MRKLLTCLTPWWAHTPDPEVTPADERAAADERADRDSRHARALHRYMARQRQENHFSQRIAAAHQPRRLR